MYLRTAFSVASITLASIVLFSMILGPAMVGAQDPPEAPEADPETADEPKAKIEPRTGNDPNWFNNLLARTTEPLPVMAVAPEDGFFKASVPAKLIKPLEVLEGSYLLTLDFGPGESSLAECYVYRDELDMAGSLYNFSDAVFEILEGMYGDIEAKAIQGVDGGGFGPTPYLGVSWIYRAKGSSETGSVAGQAKHWVSIKQGHSLYCQTTAIGYDAAFFNLFQSFATTVEYSEELESKPYFEDLSQVKIGDQVVGVARTIHRIDGDGDIEAWNGVGMLLPVDQQTLQSQDSVSVEYSTLGGELIAKVEVDAENSEVSTQLNMSRTESGSWVVSGMFQGKDLAKDLGQADLRSEFGQRLDFREFMKTAELNSVMSVREWVPDMDPTQLADTQVVYLGPHEKGISVKIEAGPLSFTGVSDEVMSLLSMTMPIGAAELRMERIHAQGDVLYPLILQKESEPSDIEVPEAAPEADPKSESGT